MESSSSASYSFIRGQVTTMDIRRSVMNREVAFIVTTRLAGSVSRTS